MITNPSITVEELIQAFETYQKLIASGNTTAAMGLTRLGTRTIWLTYDAFTKAYQLRTPWAHSTPRLALSQGLPFEEIVATLHAEIQHYSDFLNRAWKPKPHQNKVIAYLNGLTAKKSRVS